MLYVNFEAKNTKLMKILIIEYKFHCVLVIIYFSFLSSQTLFNSTESYILTSFYLVNKREGICVGEWIC